MYFFNTYILSIWRIIFEEYGTYMEYNQGKKISGRCTISISHEHESIDYPRFHLYEGNYVQNK